MVGKLGKTTVRAGIGRGGAKKLAEGGMKSTANKAKKLPKQKKK